MKRVAICLAVQTVAVFILTEVSVGQWYQQNSGTTWTLNSVHFVDVNSGWAVGDSASSGTILKTTDGGNSWTNQNSDPNRLIEVYFTDSNNGWAVGGNVFVGGTILSTTNGGNSWTTQTSGLILLSVHFTDSDNGWVVGYAGRIFKTTDGGKIWTDQSSGTTAPLNSVCFTDSNNGWAVGSGGIILNTTDGGKNWIAQSVGTTNNLYTVYFKDSNTGWMVGGDHEGNIGIILRTTDGGNNWTIQSNGTTAPLRSVYFTDSNTGWVVGNNGTVLHTTNGGVTFIEGDEVDEIPTDFSLLQNYPNPFNPSTTIRYELPKASMVRLSVYDILGREVSVLVNERKNAGSYEVKFDGTNLASGVYFYRIQAGDFVQAKKLIVLR